MLKILAGRMEIAEVQEAFSQTIRDLPLETLATAIGFQGGSFNTQVWWLASLGFWAHFGSPPSQKANWDRYWNVFGLGRPAKSVRIICLINSPLDGINNRIGGAFAADGSGRYFILHRGNFRSHGMTKSFFWHHYQGPTAETQDGSERRTLVLAMTLGSPYGVSDLRNFVREVDRIKRLPR
jgi:hypothetical protein